MSDLEPRLLFSATPIDMTAVAGTEQTMMVAPAELADQSSQSQSTDSIAASTSTQTTSRELVFVDSMVSDLQDALDNLNGSSRNFEVFVLDANRDGLDQITEILDSRRDVDSIHIISHSENGAVKLGNLWLGASNLDGYAGQLASWQNSLAADADILLYGCDLAASESGLTLIDSIHALTGADVAASDDDTGHASFGADWELEYFTGTIETEIALSADLQQNWYGKLATITVTRFDDITDGGDGLTSLREAITLATSGDTIVLSAGNYTLSIAGTGEDLNVSGDLDITKNLTIRGVSAAATTINGGGIDRVFEVQNGFSLTLEDLTITGGNIGDKGGGVYVSGGGGQLTMQRVIVTANFGNEGGGIYNTGTSTLTDVVLSNNGNVSTTTAGGGLYNRGVATLNRVTISGNAAGQGGGIHHDSTANGLILTNVTVSGNTGTSGGGGLYSQANATIKNSTFTLNTADTGGGIRRQAGTLTIFNTILSNNTGTSSNPDVQGAFVSQGKNLIANTTGSTGFGAGDITGSSGMLGALADNGGFGKTHALLVGSPAINAGNFTGAPTVDGRGMTSTDGRLDIGAYQTSAFVLNRLYWTDEGNGKIRSSALDGTDIVDLITGLNSPDDLVIDSINGKLYWSESQTGKIRRANLDGSNIVDVLTGLDDPQDIELDIANGHIYWIQDGSTERIVRSDLDGNNQVVLINTQLNFPDHLALDLQNGKMYWADEFTRKIERSNLDGSMRELVVTANQAPLSIAIDPYNGKLYWTNFDLIGGNDRIIRADFNGSNQTAIVTTGLSIPDNLIVDHANGKIYWTDTGNNTIKQANLDGSNVLTLALTGSNRPKGIALGPTASGPTNVDPIASAGSGYTIREGQTLNLDGSASSDSDGTIVSYQWDLDNDGVFGESGEPTTATANVNWATLSSFGINEGDVGGKAYTIRLRVTDNNGATNDATVIVTVIDTAPVITVSGASTSGSGVAYALNLSATDFGADDATTGWIVNWDDGSITTYGAVTTASHVYTGGIGLTRNITVSAINGDGTFHQSQLLLGGELSQNVLRFAATTGELLQSFATSETLTGHSAMLVGPDGLLYVGGGSANVLRYNAMTGAFVDVFVSPGSGGLGTIKGMTFGPDGNLYVTSGNTNSVLRFNGTTGAFISTFVTAGSGGLNNPHNLKFGPDGNLYVASLGSDQVLRYNAATGAFMNAFITAGSGGLDGPGDLIFRDDGNVYVTSYNNDRVLRFNATTGVYVDTFIAAASGSLDGPIGMSFGPDGNLYVASNLNDRLLRYNGTTGAFIDTYIAAGYGGLDGSQFPVFTPAVQVKIVAPDNLPIATADTYVVNEGTTLNSNSAWFDNAWKFRRTISFDNRLQTQNLTNLPVLIQLDSSRINYAQTQDNGADLRFVDGNGTLLAYEIESWNESGTSYVWVNVPQIDQSSRTDFVWMYYGNVAAPAGQNGEAVWSSEYAGVYHLGANELDATNRNNDGVNAGSVNATGRFGDGQLFDGSNDIINLGSATSIDDLFTGGGSVSAWINPTGWGQGGYGRIFDKANGISPSPNGWNLSLDQANQSLIFEVGFSSTIGRWRVSPNSITLNQWTQVTVVYSSNSVANDPIIYINGVAQTIVESQTPVGTYSTDAAQDLRIGNYSTLTRTFDGRIDEARLFDGTMSAQRVAAEYVSATNNLALFGYQQTKAGVLGNDFDPNGDSLTATLVGGPSNAQSFTLNADGTFTYTPTTNFSGSDSFTYIANDGSGNSGIVTVAISVTPVNDAPSDITLSNTSVNENSAGAVIGTVGVVDPDVGDTHVWTVNDARFEIVGNQLKLKTGQSLDRENQPTVNLTITVTDQNGGGLSYNESFTITTNNVNEAPTDITLSDSSVNENSIGAVIGTVGVVDPDASDTHAWTVDDARFEIVGNQLRLKAGQSLDHETEATVNLTITATDQNGGGIAYGESFAIVVNDINEAPTSIELTKTTVDGGGFGAIVGELTAIDPDAGDAHGWSVDDARFTIVAGTLKLKSDQRIDSNIESTVNLIVTAMDSGGLMRVQAFAVTVNAQPAAPPLYNPTVGGNTPSPNNPSPNNPPPDADSGDNRSDTSGEDDSDAGRNNDSGTPAISPSTIAKTPQSPTTTTSGIPGVVIDESMKDTDDDDSTGSLVGSGNVGVQTLEDAREANENNDLQSRGERTTAQLRHLGLSGANGSAGQFNFDLMSRPGVMWNELDKQMETIESQIQGDLIVVGAAGAAASSFTVGIVAWGLRTGFLASGLLAQMPAWRAVDPLLIMQGSGDSDNESLEELMKRRSEALDELEKEDDTLNVVE